MELKDFFTEHPKVALAFSGGADSSYLLYEAKRLAREVAVYYVKTAFQPMFELEDALRLSRELKADCRVLCLNALTPEVSLNPPDRCYFCKRRLFSAIAERAAAEGFTALIDGTNADDAEDDRPGMAALKELGVLSPLRLCNIGKAEIRARSREAGLFTWDKPAYACLATRTPAGERIELKALKRTEAAESALCSLGFSDLRVRNRCGGAVIQLPKEQLPLAVEKRDELLKALKPEYPFVLLDLEARDEH